MMVLKGDICPLDQVSVRCIWTGGMLGQVLKFGVDVKRAFENAFRLTNCLLDGRTPLLALYKVLDKGLCISDISLQVVPSREQRSNLFINFITHGDTGL